MIVDIARVLADARQLLDRPPAEARTYLYDMAVVLHRNARDPAVNGHQRAEALRLAQACEARRSDSASEG